MQPVVSSAHQQQRHPTYARQCSHVKCLDPSPITCLCLCAVLSLMTLCDNVNSSSSNTLRQYNKKMQGRSLTQWRGADLQLHVSLQAAHHNRASSLRHPAGDGWSERAVQQLRVLMCCFGLCNARLSVPLVRIYPPYKVLRVLHVYVLSVNSTICTWCDGL